MIWSNMGDKETNYEAISIALMRGFEGSVSSRTCGNINKGQSI